jgi:hypothetical protein
MNNYKGSGGENEQQSKKQKQANKKRGLQLKLPLKVSFTWVPVAHTCNPSYSGGRDQKDCGLKPA